MVSANLIRDDLFSILWNTNAAPNNIQQTVEVNNLTKVFKFCQLSYTRNGVDAILEIEIHFSDTPKPIQMENILVEASKNGIKKKMSITRQSEKWTTSWTETTCPSCYSETLCLQCKAKPTDAGLCFEIVIDLAPVGFLQKLSHQPVIDHLLNLWKTKTLADVEFQCHGKSIKAHTLILASGSPVMAAMFENELKEKEERVINISEIKPNIFENLLEYIYTGDAAVENEVEDVAELLVAADRYVH